MSWETWRAENRANWDDRVPVHVGPGGYDIDALLADPSALSGVVRRDAPYLGDLRGLDAVHLQCHIGTDTLSLARLGASVTGLDFSPAALAEARSLFERTGTPGRFVQSDVYDAAAALGATYDLVYTGIGALNWLPSVSRWARVAASLLKPGGRLYVRDGHPMFFTLDYEAPPGELRIAEPYFEHDAPQVNHSDQTYQGNGTPIAHTRMNEWSHGMAETVQGLLDGGLAITAMREHAFCEWQAFPWMVPGDDDTWVLPEGRNRLPFLFTLEARRPE